MGRLGGTDGGVGEKKGGWKGVDGFGRGAGRRRIWPACS